MTRLTWHRHFQWLTNSPDSLRKVENQGRAWTHSSLVYIGELQSPDSERRPCSYCYASWDLDFYQPKEIEISVFPRDSSSDPAPWAIGAYFEDPDYRFRYQHISTSGRAGRTRNDVNEPVSSYSHTVLPHAAGSPGCCRATWNGSRKVLSWKRGNPDS